jgi:hypothetical protein
MVVERDTNPKLIRSRKDDQGSWDFGRALELLHQGKTCREIASVLGIKREQVYDAFRTRHIPIVPDKRGSRPSWDMDRAKDLADQGYPICDIARIMGLPQDLVRSGFKNRGWKPLQTRSGRYPTWDVDKAKKLREKGLRWVDIDRELELSPGTVRHHFVRHELHKPRNQPNMQWDINQARRLRRDGLGWREIGERVGTHGNNVRRAFVRRGWFADLHPKTQRQKIPRIQGRVPSLRGKAI